MAAVAIHQPVPRQSPTPPPHPHTLSLNISRPGSAPIPNKHIPFCPTGPSPSSQLASLATPPDSPPSKNSALQTFSLLHPADTYAKVNDSPPLYTIDVFTLNAALNDIATQAYPDPKHGFPWLHGLHPENQVQLAFFITRRKAQLKTPKCFRGITIVKVGGDLNHSRLKGAISPEEVLDLNKGRDATFLEVDPKEGFSVRNFQIQATKMALVSDIVVYGDARTSTKEISDLAKKFDIAQSTWRVEGGYVGDEDAPVFSTFIMSSESTTDPRRSLSL